MLSSSVSFVGNFFKKVYDDLIAFNFNKNEWEQIQPSGPKPVSTI